MTTRPIRSSQCSKPTGWRGRFVLWRMNSGHSKLTDWGLEHLEIKPGDTILDAGCGGGRTIRKLAARATPGKVYGIDHSEESVAASRRNNADAIVDGRVAILPASVSHLPFPENRFDLVTAVESHFWWPDLPGDMREIFRVLKPGGAVLLVAEVYKGAGTTVSRLAERFASRTGLKLLSADEHRHLCVNAGFADVQIFEQRQKGWICAFGRKPL